MGRLKKVLGAGFAGAIFLACLYLAVVCFLCEAVQRLLQYAGTVHRVSHPFAFWVCKILWFFLAYFWLSTTFDGGGRRKKLRARKIQAQARQIETQQR